MRPRFQVSGFRCQETEDRSQMTEDFEIQELRDSGIKVSVNGNDFTIIKLRIILTWRSVFMISSLAKVGIPST
jgi:hypothetical protein